MGTFTFTILLLNFVCLVCKSVVIGKLDREGEYLIGTDLFLTNFEGFPSTANCPNFPVSKLH